MSAAANTLESTKTFKGRAGLLYQGQCPIIPATLSCMIHVAENWGFLLPLPGGIRQVVSSTSQTWHDLLELENAKPTSWDVDL